MTQWLLLSLALSGYPPPGGLTMQPVFPAQWDEEGGEDDFDMPEGDFELPAGDPELDPPPKEEPKKEPKKEKSKPEDDLFVDDSDIEDDDILVPADDDEPAPAKTPDPWGTGAEEPSERPVAGAEEPAPAAEEPGRRRLIAGDEPAPDAADEPRGGLLEDEDDLKETHELRLEAEEPGSAAGLDPLTISAIAGGGALLAVGLVVGVGAAVVITGPPVLGIWQVPEGFLIPGFGGPDTGSITVEPR